jgi:uncharacterized protein YlxW (UPF0749 family)
VLTVALVAAIAGLMFTASAQLAHGDDAVRRPADLPELVQSESDRVEKLTAKVDALQAQIDQLSGESSSGAPHESAKLARREEVAVGAVPVTGPGLRVSLDDAPSSSLSIPGVSADDVVVHQQDLQAVINALWAGGAEAMTLQGERVTASSAFRCAGSILLLHGKVFSPPYVVEAVGDPTAMRAALNSANDVGAYLSWVDRVGLGWSVETPQKLTMPAYSGSTDLRYATLPAGTDPLR